MALTKQDATIVPYVRQNASGTEDIAIFIASELRRIENTLRQTVSLTPQVYISEPKTKLNGMIVTNKAPWDPLGLGDGLVRWNGTTWVAVGVVGASNSFGIVQQVATGSGVQTLTAPITPVYIDSLFINGLWEDPTTTTSIGTTITVPTGFGVVAGDLVAVRVGYITATLYAFATQVAVANGTQTIASTYPPTSIDSLYINGVWQVSSSVTFVGSTITVPASYGVLIGDTVVVRYNR